MVPSDLLADYNRSRAVGVDRAVLCHAPFVSLNFDQSGQVTACCYNRSYVLGTYPAQSIREIWESPAADELRTRFVTGAEAPGCDACFDQLRSRNFASVLMRNFDVYGRKRPASARGVLPLALEFEISNTCSLECVMCAGHWSSAIRANREKLPPVRNPYDARFVEQVLELLPTLVAAKFLGGEPFLITRYLEIWEGIRRINPAVEVSITTSGAVLPPRARQALEGLRANIVVSLDGITKKTYESIRRNARFEQVLDHIAYFRDYTRRKRTELTLAICPMTHNWRELRAIVDFAESRDLPVYFNTVSWPLEASLRGLPEAELAVVIDQLEQDGQASRWQAASTAQWQGLLNQLREWLDRKKQPRLAAAGRAAALRNAAATYLGDMGISLSPGVGEALERFTFAGENAKVRLNDPDAADLLTGRFGSPRPSSRDLVLAAHLFSRFPEPRVGHSEAAVAGDEHRRLVRFLDAASGEQAFGSWEERAGARLIEYIDTADVHAVRRFVDDLVCAVGQDGLLEVARQVSIDRLSTTRLDDATRERVRAYLTNLTDLAWGRLYAALALTDDEAPRPVEAMVIETVGDLHAALHAIALFHESRVTVEAAAVLRARLDAIHGYVSGGAGESLVRAAQGTTILDAYRFLAFAADEEFATAMTAASVR